MFRRLLSGLLDRSDATNSPDQQETISDSDNFDRYLDARDNWQFERIDEYEFEHYTDAIERIKQLKRERRHDEVEDLLLWCIDFAENEVAAYGWDTVPPAYYRHLAIVYRKDDRNDDEVAILERYIDQGGEMEGMISRLERARELNAIEQSGE
ncbi:hypothetical protein [Halalkalicoccus sp. NIPERK01]|uniref:hypothetical protein n=1 Tax=Halalkalicoccus sp. NIPERK01 TaxID=3053469 RepID=UPI00256EFB29|nr:hypothetical protein [Halalkalicoccus sp. NIPERK01]MDL5361323.1 hypothetical protein [Halalkalicoccus sp. NIPERK01]